MGVDVHTGATPAILAQAAFNPCARAYKVYCSDEDHVLGWCEEGAGRASWDPIAVLFAVRGPGSIFELQPGHNRLCAPEIPECENWFSGINFWQPWPPNLRGPWAADDWRWQVHTSIPPHV